MLVFDDIERSRTDTPHQDEPRYPYLNLSARPEAAHVRALVEAWFNRYPESHRPPLTARFCSSIDEEHHSAFFELFLHELLVSNGHHIVEIEPEVPNCPKRPDFLVESDLGHRFYLEAILSTGRSTEEAKAVKRLNTALRAIDTFPSPGHFLDLSVRGTPDKPVSINVLKTALKAWVDMLPHGKQSAVAFSYQEHGMRIRLDAYPKTAPKPGRAIGARHFPIGQVVADEDLRSAIAKKAKRYGLLPLPYIVAVNSLGWFQEEHHVMDAVLGSEVVVPYQKSDGTYAHHLERKLDGIWLGPKGPRKQVLSAVFATREVTPWNFETRIGRLIRNPYATNPLPHVQLSVHEINPVEGVWKKVEGATFGKVFNLPKGWPAHG